MSFAPRQSLTLILPLANAALCARELEQRAASIAEGWSRASMIHTASLTLLPRTDHEPCALLCECTFDGELLHLATALWRDLGADLRAVFACAEGAELSAGPGGLHEFLRARARRATPLGGSLINEPEHPYRAAWRRAAEAFCDVRLLCAERSDPAPKEVEEAREAAVGWQESEPGVPLVHVAEVPRGAHVSARLKRALRAVGVPALGESSAARFLLGHGRLVFLAYPEERAAPFSERLSKLAGRPLARIWAHTRTPPARLLFVRRALRKRRLERFVQSARVPVAVWFNAG